MNPLSTFAVTQSLATRPDAPVGAAASRARATADEFERMVLEDMVGRVFETMEEGGTFGEAGPGSDVYRSMLVKEYAGMMVKSGGIGLSDQVYAEMLKLQEGA